MWLSSGCVWSLSGDPCTTGGPTALPEAAAAPEGPCPRPGGLLGLTLAKDSRQGYLKSSGSSSLPTDGEPRPRTSYCRHLRGPGGGAGDRWDSLRTGKGHGEADTHSLPQAAPPALHAPLWDVSSRPMALVMTHKCRSQRGCPSSSRSIYPSSHWTLPLNIPSAPPAPVPNKTQHPSSNLFFQLPFSPP